MGGAVLCVPAHRISPFFITRTPRTSSMKKQLSTQSPSFVLQIETEFNSESETESETEREAQGKARTESDLLAAVHSDHVLG